MQKELIELAVNEAIEKIIDIMEDFKIDRYGEYKSAIDSSINNIIDETVERTVHSLADTIAYEFKLKHYKNLRNTDKN